MWTIRRAARRIFHRQSIGGGGPTSHSDFEGASTASETDLDSIDHPSLPELFMLNFEQQRSFRQVIEDEMTRKVTVLQCKFRLLKACMYFLMAVTSLCFLFHLLNFSYK